MASGFSIVSPALAEIDAFSELTVVAGVEVVRGRVLIVCLVLVGSTTVEGFVCLVSGEIAVVVSCPEFTIVEVVEVLTAGVEVCKVVVRMVFGLTMAIVGGVEVVVVDVVEVLEVVLVMLPGAITTGPSATCGFVVVALVVVV